MKQFIVYESQTNYYVNNVNLIDGHVTLVSKFEACTLRLDEMQANRVRTFCNQLAQLKYGPIQLDYRVHECVR